jgi:hypothetical protein
MVVETGSGEVVLDQAVDTGVRGFDEAGSGLAVEAPFTLAVETDDYVGQHQVRRCRYWQVYNAVCEDWTEPMTTTLCAVPIRGGVAVPVGDGCCFDDGMFMGTGGVRVYLPLVARGGGPSRP